jgi:hypothetical protein
MGDAIGCGKGGHPGDGAGGEMSDGRRGAPSLPPDVSHPRFSVGLRVIARNRAVFFWRPCADSDTCAVAIRASAKAPLLLGFGVYTGCAGLYSLVGTRRYPDPARPRADGGSLVGAGASPRGSVLFLSRAGVEVGADYPRRSGIGHGPVPGIAAEHPRAR